MANQGARDLGEADQTGTARVHAQVTREGIPIAMRGLAIVYLLHTVYHAFGAAGVPVLAFGTGATALVYGVASLWLPSRLLRLDAVHYVAGAAALLALANVVVHYAIEPSAGSSVHFLLFIVAAGVAILNPWLLVIILGSAVMSWAALTMMHQGTGALVSASAVNVVVATIIALILRLTHGRTVAAVLRAEARQRDAEKLEAIGRLAGGVAHDFNNLLTVIRVNARYALRSAELHDEGAARADLRDILTAADRAAALTQELLSFARRQMLTPRVIDLADAVAASARTIERIVGERVEVRLERQPGTACVEVDPQLVERILFNLAANARDAMPYGGALTVETRALELHAEPPSGELASLLPGPYVVLRVADNGVGMDPPTLARVFEPFFTTKSHGTGLGLATVYGAVKQSGGTVIASSTLGRGTSFDILLPRVSDASAAARLRGGVVNDVAVEAPSQVAAASPSPALAPAGAMPSAG